MAIESMTESELDCIPWDDPRKDGAIKELAARSFCVIYAPASRYGAHLASILRRMADDGDVEVTRKFDEHHLLWSQVAEKGDRPGWLRITSIGRRALAILQHPRGTP